MARKLTKNSWGVDIRFRGKRIRMISPDNTRAGAKAYEELLRQRLARGEPIIESEAKVLSFKEFTQKWFEVYVRNNNKPSEQRTKERILRVHLVPFFGKFQLDSIQNVNIEEYKASRLNKGLVAKTINNQLTVLSKCLVTAKEWGVIDDVPIIKLLRVAPSDFDHLTHEECDLLLSGAENEGVYKSMLLLALRTGLRFGELIALDWRDVDWNKGQLTIRRSIVDGKLQNSTKGNKIRYIPLTKEVSEMLTMRKKMDGYVFNRDGEPIIYSSSCNVLVRVCKRAGMRNIGWHVCRHTFASHLAQNGIPLQSIQKLMGHSDIRTTQRYSHLSSSNLKDAVATLEPKQAFFENMGQYMSNGIATVPKITQNKNQDTSNILANVKRKEV